MLYEHEQGRRHIRAIAEALKPASCGEAAAAQVVADNLRAYAGLLRSHIRKEDSVLFPMAERLLTADDRAHLAAEFDRIEHEETGAGVHEKYHALAHELVGEG
jgi:hemerythrin-like domain-containing protein